MANILNKHLSDRHGPEYRWSDNQLLSPQAKFPDLDVEQFTLRTVLLWKLAGMVEGGTSGGAYITFDVLRVFNDGNVGVD
jgi:hypothetical protein